MVDEVSGIDCPNCGNLVEPVRRRVPNAIRDDRISAGFSVAFGDFCPMEGCGHRFDNKPANPTESSDEKSNEATVERAKPSPNKVAQIRPSKDSEDLFSRIRREHEEAVREEQELTARLEAVIEKREKLDRLMVALAGIHTPIAAE